jgi:alpha-glucosidase
MGMLAGVRQRWEAHMAKAWRWCCAAVALLCALPAARACEVAPGIDTVAPGILHMAPAGANRDASWAVLPVREALPPSTLHASLADTACTLAFADGDMGLSRVQRDSIDGRPRLRLALQPQDRVYGLGDKAGPLDRRGRSFVNWNTDAYAWDAARDPLYKSIPFLMVLRDGKAFGIFVDNTHRTVFDVGKDDPQALTITADAGALDLYVIAGPAPRDVLQRYTALTGRTPLPPKWALGFQQSRYTYTPAARVREVAATLRAHRIPADAIWLDIGFQDRNRPFTIDRKAFPDFEAMLGELRGQGFRSVLITDLHIAKQPGYAPYDSGKAIDAFVKRDGADYVGKVWPGDSVFPDFSLSRVRRWWGGLYAEFVRMGAAGFWNDMNEPSVFDGPGGTMPDDVVHRLDDGGTRDHRALHNVYGMLNAQATYDGLHALQPVERPFVLTRAAYAGTQRYAATWTGDNTASWHHLAQSTPNLLSLGLSGYALAGDDIGGFIGSPPPELLTRWYQLGAWNPLFRSHAATDTRGHEPWVDGPEHEARRRAAIELRYRLLPYLYTLAEDNARTGAPYMRPVWFGFPDAKDFYGNDRDFLFGDDLFVAPVVSERLDPHVVRLPPGTWYGLRDGNRHAATEPVTFDPAPTDVPVFARAGAIVPMQPLVQHTGETPDGPLEVHVWWPDAGAPCGGSLYDDDGHGRGYRDGAFLRLRFECALREGALEVSARAGHADFAPWWKAVDVVVHRTDGTTHVEHLQGPLTQWQVRIDAASSATLPARQ